MRIIRGCGERAQHRIATVTVTTTTTRGRERAGERVVLYSDTSLRIILWMVRDVLCREFRLRFPDLLRFAMADSILTYCRWIPARLRPAYSRSYFYGRCTRSSAFTSHRNICISDIRREREISGAVAARRCFWKISRDLRKLMLQVVNNNWCEYAVTASIMDITRRRCAQTTIFH